MTLQRQATSYIVTREGLLSDLESILNLNKGFLSNLTVQVYQELGIDEAQLKDLVALNKLDVILQPNKLIS